MGKGEREEGEIPAAADLRRTHAASVAPRALNEGSVSAASVVCCLTGTSSATSLCGRRRQLCFFPLCSFTGDTVRSTRRGLELGQQPGCCLFSAQLGSVAVVIAGAAPGPSRCMGAVRVASRTVEMRDELLDMSGGRGGDRASKYPTFKKSLMKRYRKLSVLLSLVCF